RRLEESHTFLREESAPRASATIGATISQMDLESMVTTIQEASGEIELDRLVDRLLTTAVEQTGAERGPLLLVHDGEAKIEAEATSASESVNVRLVERLASPEDLPGAVLHYVERSHESVLLHDASTHPTFATDEYVRRRRSRSVLCLPLVRQGIL